MFLKILNQNTLNSNKCLLTNGGRHFLDIEDFTKAELQVLIDISIDLKNTRNKCRYKNAFKNKTLLMIFEKQSLRTRISFDIGFTEMSGNVISLNKNDIHLGYKETIADTARVISSMAHLVMIRCYNHQSTLIDFAKNSSVPVINGLTDYSHPCQIIAALACFKNYFGKDYLSKKFVWIGAYNNVLLSYIQAAKLMGFDFNISCPDGFALPEDLMLKISAIKNIQIFSDPKTAIRNCDIVITDTWVSMGDDFNFEDVKNKFMPFQVNKDLMNLASDGAVFSHCLPAIRGQEVTSEIIDSSLSLVFSEAEFRLHSQKAIMLYIANLL